MANTVKYTDPATGSEIATNEKDYANYVRENETKGGGFLGLKTLWNAITDPFTKDKYALKTEQQNVRNISYFEDYYTGCDAVVLIGDIWVDDIITIQYSITNNKSPIYGYMSEEFDAVAKGTVIVQGQFVVAFKEVGYIPKILQQYKDRKYTIPSKREFSTIEKRIGSEVENQFAGIDRSIESSGLEQGGLVRADHFGYSNSPSGGKVDVDGFDIIVVYGNIGGFRGGTIETINSIHITSKSLAVEPSGEPIAEIYSFFGKCVNNGLSNYSGYFSNAANDKASKSSNAVEQVEQVMDVQPSGVLPPEEKTPQEINASNIEIATKKEETIKAIEKAKPTMSDDDYVEALNKANVEYFSELNANAKVWDRFTKKNSFGLSEDQMYAIYRTNEKAIKKTKLSSSQKTALYRQNGTNFNIAKMYINMDEVP